MEKITLNILAFFTAGASFILIYTFLNWLIFIKLELVDLAEETVDLFIPFLLLIIPFIFFLKPRLELIKFKSKNTIFYYLIIAAILILLPNAFVQIHLKESNAKLTELDSISSISEYKKTNYYTVKNYYVSEQDAGLQFAAEDSGTRRRKKLKLYLYITLPIYDSFTDRQKANVAWLGIKYDKEISSHLSADEKEKELDAFISESQKGFQLKRPSKIYSSC